MAKRQSTVRRKTAETDICAKAVIDGRGAARLDIGIPFLNHMLSLTAKHGLFDFEIRAKGDLDVDIHHTNEDTGITLGQAFAKALGTKAGIRRYGFFSAPMDEALVRVSLDISGRPSLHVSKPKGLKMPPTSANYSFQDACEHLRAFCMHTGINLHVEVVSGLDPHHVIEATFKAFAKALDMATQIDPRVKGIPSTKGSL